MLIAMVIIFAICWLPLNIVHMVAEFHGSKLRHYKVLFLSTHVIAMSSTIYNPFLYSWLNDNFRKEFQQIIPCLFKICVCFNRDTLNNMNTNGDRDMYNDRPSTHQIPADLILNGKTNGYTKNKKSNLENVQLKSIKQIPVIEEPLLMSNNSKTVDTDLNNM
jgi:neuropeptide Y receptor